MELVVDAAVVFAALIKRGFTLELIRLLHKSGWKLYSPEYVLEEIEKREARLLRFSGLSKPEFDFVLGLLFRNIKTMPLSEYSGFLPEASRLLPEHQKDAPYFALALSLNCPVWSNEVRFTKQSRVKILPTHMLKMFFGL